VKNEHVIVFIKFYTTEKKTSMDWYEVWWRGFKKPTIQPSHEILKGLASNLDHAKQFLTHVKKKGNADGVSRTRNGGQRGDTTRNSHLVSQELDGRNENCMHMSIDNVADPVLFKAKGSSCVPYALCNILRVSNNQARKLLNRFSRGSHTGGLDDLAMVSQMLKCTLKVHDEKTLQWLLQQRSGFFLVMFDIHCVSVDCAKSVIYDSAEDFVLPLTLHNLIHRCKIREAEQLREVMNTTIKTVKNII
jgi:hypothetical protein